MSLAGYYTTVNKIRLYTGISTEDVATEELERYLEPATKAIIEQITICRHNELLKRADDKIYYTPFIPLADVDGDKAVTASDLDVYSWTALVDYETRTKESIKSVDANTGRIELSSAPSGQYVTADYRCYPNKIDWGLVEIATSYYAGYLCLLTDWLFIPESYSLGPIRVRGSLPYDKLYKQYIKTLNLVVKRPFSVSKKFRIKELGELEEELDA